jgi:hypothetical protein
MNKLTTTISVLLLGAALSMTGCKKDDEKKADDKAAKKADEKKVEDKKAEPADTKGDEAAAGTASTGMPDCDALIAAYADLAKCDKMPKESRDAMAQGLDAMKQGWGDTAKMDDATKKMMGDSCKQGLDGLKQTMSATGC